MLWAFCGLTGANSGPTWPSICGGQAAMTRPGPLVPAYTWPTAPQNAAVTCASVLTPVARFVLRGGGGGEERVGGVVLGLQRVLLRQVRDDEIHDLRRSPNQSIGGSTLT